MIQKTGLLDIKTNIAVNNGRCNWWLALEADSLAPERWRCRSRDSVGSRCKDSTNHNHHHFAEMFTNSAIRAARAISTNHAPLCRLQNCGLRDLQLKFCAWIVGWALADRTRSIERDIYIGPVHIWSVKYLWLFHTYRTHSIIIIIIIIHVDRVK